MKNDRSIIDDEIIKQKMAEYMEMKITEYIDEYMDINSDHLKPSQLNEYEMKRPEIGDFINEAVTNTPADTIVKQQQRYIRALNKYIYKLENKPSDPFRLEKEFETYKHRTSAELMERLEKAIAAEIKIPQSKSNTEQSQNTPVHEKDNSQNRWDCLHSRIEEVEEKMRHAVGREKKLMETLHTYLNKEILKEFDKEECSPGSVLHFDLDNPTPHTCPVCAGTKHVPPNFYGDMTVSTFCIPCRSCNGTGIAWN